MKRFKRKLTLLEVIGDALLIAFGLILLYQFITIGIVGWYGFEPSSAILRAEIAMAALIFLFGIERLINDVKKRRH